MDRFGPQLKVETGSTCLVNDLAGTGLTRQQDDPGIRTGATQCNPDIDAIAAGHTYIRDHNIRAEFACNFQGCFAIVGRRRFKPVHVEDAYQGVGDQVLVVNDQDARSNPVCISLCPGGRLKQELAIRQYAVLRMQQRIKPPKRRRSRRLFVGGEPWERFGGKEERRVMVP